MDAVEYRISVTANTNAYVRETLPTLPYYEYASSNGNQILTQMNPDSTGSVGIVQQPESVPDVPVLSLARSTGMYRDDGSGIYTCIQNLCVVWEPVSSADYYQVFLVENTSPDVLYDTRDLQDNGQLAGYFGTPLFMHQSGIIKNNQNSFIIDYGGKLDITRVSAFVFAYNSLGRSTYPFYCMTFLATQSKTRNVINNIYIEKTAYSNDTGTKEFYNFVDMELNQMGSDRNIDSKSLDKYQPE